MPMDSVTEESVKKLIKEKEEKEKELELIKKITIEKMWLNELYQLKEEYLKLKDSSKQLVIKKK